MIAILKGIDISKASIIQVFVIGVYFYLKNSGAFH